jgi:hypothetical protein
MSAFTDRSGARARGGGGAGAAALVLADQVHNGVDQRQVREGLREVPEVPARVRVDLLGVQQQRAGVGQQLLAQGPGAGQLPDLGQRGDQPERADGERSLLAAEAVTSQSDRNP